MVNKFGELYPPFADQEDMIVTTWEVLVATGAILFLPGHGKPIKKSILRSAIHK